MATPETVPQPQYDGGGADLVEVLFDVFGDDLRKRLDERPADPLAVVVRDVLRAADAKTNLYKSTSKHWADRAIKAESIARRQHTLIDKQGDLLDKQHSTIEKAGADLNALFGALRDVAATEFETAGREYAQNPCWRRFAQRFVELVRHGAAIRCKSRIVDHVLNVDPKLAA